MVFARVTTVWSAIFLEERPESASKWAAFESLWLPLVAWLVGNWARNPLDSAFILFLWRGAFGRTGTTVTQAVKGLERCPSGGTKVNICAHDHGASSAWRTPDYPYKGWIPVLSKVVFGAELGYCLGGVHPREVLPKERPSTPFSWVVGVFSFLSEVPSYLGHISTPPEARALISRNRGDWISDLKTVILALKVKDLRRPNIYLAHVGPRGEADPANWGTSRMLVGAGEPEALKCTGVHRTLNPSGLEHLDGGTYICPTAEKGGKVYYMVWLARDGTRTCGNMTSISPLRRQSESTYTMKVSWTKVLPPDYAELTLLPISLSWMNIGYGFVGLNVIM
ncbi:hypothetical protein FA13DRAFT_1706217, partial [Coprinellus micaceus]